MRSPLRPSKLLRKTPPVCPERAELIRIIIYRVLTLDRLLALPLEKYCRFPFRRVVLLLDRTYRGIFFFLHKYIFFIPRTRP